METLCKQIYAVLRQAVHFFATHMHTRTHAHGMSTEGKTQARPIHGCAAATGCLLPRTSPVLRCTLAPSTECPATQACPSVTTGHVVRRLAVAGNPQIHNLSPRVGLTNMGRAAGMWSTHAPTHARTHTDSDCAPAAAAAAAAQPFLLGFCVMTMMMVGSTTKER